MNEISAKASGAGIVGCEHAVHQATGVEKQVPGGTCPILGDQGRSHWLVVRSLLCHTSGFWLNLPLVLKERDLVFFFLFFCFGHWGVSVFL